MSDQFDLSAFEGLDESVTKVFTDPAVQERLKAFAEKSKEPVLSKNKEVLGKFSELQAQIKDLGGLDALKTLAQQAADARAAAEAAALKSNDVEAVRKASQAEIEKRDQRIAAMEQRELSAKTTSAVSKAIAAADGVAELLEPHVRARIKSTLDVDGKVSITVLNTDGTEMLNGVNKATVKDLIAELKANPTYQPAFKTTTQNGSGAKGGAPGDTSGMVNPFLPATRNFTKQNEIARTNPALAKALAAAAGINLPI